MADSESELKSRGIKLAVKIENTGVEHPNIYELVLKINNTSKSLKAISVGGGNIEIIQVDEIPLLIKGDCYELVIFTKNA